MDTNVQDAVVYNQPTALDERRAVARDCCEKLNLSMPTVVDRMDNQVDDAYAGWPERLFIIGTDGRIQYAGGRGPFGFKPDEVKRWLERNVR